MKSTYLQKCFTDHIDKKSIKTIVECGSRDAIDAIGLFHYYNPSIVYAFEANPESIEICRKNTEDEDQIKIEPFAVYDKNGIIPFYATDMELSDDKNIGASSVLFHRDQKEYIQKEIQVNAIRLDNFMETERIRKIDLLCMDLQGAELIALNGLGVRIKDIHYIIAEVSFQSYYKNDILEPAFTQYLKDCGFCRICFDSNVSKFQKTGFCNALYVNKTW